MNLRAIDSFRSFQRFYRLYSLSHFWYSRTPFQIHLWIETELDVYQTVQTRTQSSNTNKKFSQDTPSHSHFSCSNKHTFPYARKFTIDSLKNKRLSITTKQWNVTTDSKRTEIFLNTLWSKYINPGYSAGSLITQFLFYFNYSQYRTYRNLHKKPTTTFPSYH